MDPDAVEAAVNAAHRDEWARVLASVARITRDIDAAEDAVQDAFVSALRTWPEQGVPGNVGAWLTTTARRKALDRLRREQTLERRLPQLIVTGEIADVTEDDVVRDDRLRLIFTCCHPALAMHARVALTLRLVCGLETAEIADLFLVSEATMAARITRAKKKIHGAGIPYRVPDDGELPGRLPAVLATVHLLYTAGHTARRGRHLMRTDAIEDAVRLAGALAELMPDDPEVLGLYALLLLSHAHRSARLDTEGTLVPLQDQDRTRWDAAAIERGIRLTRRSLRLGGPRGSGPYTLQAAIAAVHAEATSYDDTDWPQIVALYDLLLGVHPSPVAALARAVAIGMASGPEYGLDEIDRLAGQPGMATFHRLSAARAHLLDRLGRQDEARVAYLDAATHAENETERHYLSARAAELDTSVRDDLP